MWTLSTDEFFVIVTMTVTRLLFSRSSSSSLGFSGFCFCFHCVGSTVLFSSCSFFFYINTVAVVHWYIKQAWQRMRHMQSLYSVSGDFLHPFFSFAPWSRHLSVQQQAQKQQAKHTELRETDRTHPQTFSHGYMWAVGALHPSPSGTHLLCFSILCCDFFPFLLPPIQCPILCFHCFFYPTMFWWDQHKCNANKYSVFICLFIYLPGCHMCFVQVMLT